MGAKVILANPSVDGNCANFQEKCQMKADPLFAILLLLGGVLLAENGLQIKGYEWLLFSWDSLHRSRINDASDGYCDSCEGILVRHYSN